MSTAIAQSSLTTSLKRYSRSWGLWLLLLVAPVGARFMVGRDDGFAVDIAINNHLPVLTSAVVGMSLGIVVSTLLLPIGYIYLRANTTRRQPWQVEEVTTGSRVAIALGRFAADALIFLGMLAALTLAGLFLAWLVLPAGALNAGELALALWLVAAPAVIGLAAIRILFDAVPLLRGALGDLAYFFLWIFSIAIPAAAQGRTPGFASNMFDFAGYVRPLTFSAGGDGNFAIGGVDPLPGRIPLDVMSGLMSPGYIESRLAWVAIAILIAAFAGLAYRPHRPRRRPALSGCIARWLSPGAPPAANPAVWPAHASAAPLLGLLAAEFRLIGRGRLFLLLTVLMAAAGLAGDYRHVGSPAALLLLIFALTGQAGRAEVRGLLRLSATTMTSPWVRRAAFVVAGLGWSLLIAVPAMVVNGSGAAHLAAATGGAAALTAMLLSAFSGSGFAARVVLLIAWYGYLSS